MASWLTETSQGERVPTWQRDGCDSQSIPGCSDEIGAEAKQGAAPRGVRLYTKTRCPFYPLFCHLFCIIILILIIIIILTIIIITIDLTIAGISALARAGTVVRVVWLAMWTRC